MLGTGLIGMFYTRTLHGLRARDKVVNVYSRSRDRAKEFAAEHGIPRWSADLEEAILDSDSDVVVVGIPNNLHCEAVLLAAQAGKAVLCTKPLGRNAQEALDMLRAVEKAGVFAGYLEDLVYTPKTLKALESARKGALGRVLWTRSRETHPGPHSAWFLDPKQSGGGAVIDMGCHCIEIGRNFIGKDVRPVEAFCWGATQVHPIEAEDHAIGLVKYANGAIGQFEVSWTFRGGMDLRDEVSGTEGTVWLDHFLRTGFEMFTAAGEGGYVAEKAEAQKGWLFPVGDEVHELGYIHMFADMLDAMDGGRAPMETFYDGYVVNAVIDACYRSMKAGRWEPVELEVWRGKEELLPAEGGPKAAGEGKTRALGKPGRMRTGAGGQTVAAKPKKSHEAGKRAEKGDKLVLLKKERMPDGRTKVIMREKVTGRIVERIER
jgi:predicted dehydrogenase